MQVSSPIHKLCPDMQGMVCPDPRKRRRSIFLIQKLREKHGLDKRSKRKAKPLNYSCDESDCWG